METEDREFGNTRSGVDGRSMDASGDPEDVLRHPASHFHHLAHAYYP